MRAYYKGSRVVVVEHGKKYPFSLGVDITKAKCIQLMTKMQINGIDMYMASAETHDISKWKFVDLKWG